MFPIPVIAARLGWMAAGAAVVAISKSKIGKEAIDMFKDGINGMGEDYRRDMTPKQKQEVKDKEQMVKDIRSGKQ